MAPPAVTKFRRCCAPTEIPAVPIQADYCRVIPLTLDQIATEAMQLPASSRSELAEKVVESLDFSEDDDVQRAWTTEAVRRRDEVRSGRVKTVPGEQVLDQVRRMLGSDPVRVSH